MLTPIRYAIAILGLAIYSGAALAQQPASAPAQPNSNKIYLNVVVAPKSGKPVAGLQQQDFTLTDNNVAQPISSFEAVEGAQSQMEIVLVIDAVNLDYSRIAYEREQIDKFLKANGGHLAHPVSLAIFTDAGVELQQVPSHDGNQLSASLDKSDIALRIIHRDSQYGDQDRIDLSLNALHTLLVKESTRPGRKLIFWISPGWPLLSGPRIQLDAKEMDLLYSQVVGVSNLLQRTGITLYSIDPMGAGQNVGREFYYQDFLKAVTKPSQAEFGNLGLQVLAIRSGGLALTASNDTAQQIQQCVDDTAAYYRIAYHAPPAEHGDSQYHAIDIKVSTPGLAARTLAGYYAQP
jgi:VWFA-related protein